MFTGFFRRHGRPIRVAVARAGGGLHNSASQLSFQRAQTLSKLPVRNPIYRVFVSIDSLISSSAFEFTDWLRRTAQAYSVFLDRFRISGMRRIFIDMIDDGATFGMFFGLGLLMFALPPFSGTGDIWNWAGNMPSRSPTSTARSSEDAA